MKIVQKRQKPVYSSNLTHLEISHYRYLSDKKIKGIVCLFPNIVHLDFNFSTGFSDKTLNRIAESYPNLKYLNLQKDEYVSCNMGIITGKGLYAIARCCTRIPTSTVVRPFLHVSATHSQGGELKIGTVFLNFYSRIKLGSQKHISITLFHSCSLLIRYYL